MNINCLIIDDEPSSQIVLKTFVSQIKFLTLSGVCNNAVEALTKLKSDSTIQLLFLDINMPQISGLSFYKSLQNPPLVIFTTAYPQYAIEGFEVNATDYLLKPFSFDRFFTAVNKVVDKMNGTEPIKNVSEHLLVKADKKLHKIHVSDIIYIEAFGDYVKIHQKGKCLLTNNTFKNIFNLLPKENFIQVHKSFAVNLKKINIIDGNQIIIDNHKIPIGLTYKSFFLEKFKNE